MALYAFSKSQRLGNAHDFSGVFEHTVFKVHQPGFLILASTQSNEQFKHARLGLVVAKKKVKKSHERQRVKRISRESFRINQYQLVGLDIVVMPKIGVEQIPNAELFSQFDFAWKKLQRLLAKKKTVNNNTLSLEKK